MPNVALYARYSTDNQSVVSIEDQFRICSKNHIFTHSKHGNCSLHWHRKTDLWAKLHEAQGLRQRHRLRSPLYIQEDCRSDCRVKVSCFARGPEIVIHHDMWQTSC